ncbi:DUF456 family protein [Akkermansia sp. N21116]|uniref:DUF456 domain-containing protein n=1 Tax=Akkermansia sp. N21116 TaxID=3040764 RepID=UPI00244E8D4B|nr:DUF456 family protein [Akkermansia sp. N21116]WPX39594.1 DUF456 family protein [Akkermansia sp. N21116]
MDIILQYSLQTALTLLVLILVGMGLAGCVIPVVPGHPMIFLGCMTASFISSSPEYSPGWVTWGALALLCIIGMLGDNICTYWGAKRFGSTKAGLWGSLIGLLIGGFFSQWASSSALSWGPLFLRSGFKNGKYGKVFPPG